MKLSLIEYGIGIMIPDDTRPLIEHANKVICKALRIKRDALVVSDGMLRAIGIAGTIRLSKELELEILPKIFGDSYEDDWKESLFLLAALSKYGNIITNEHIHSNTAYKDSLYDIAGRILAREYSNHKRKLIRQYRHERFIDYSIDGEIDFDCAFEKNSEGIAQEKISFDIINPINATIQEAMKIVLPYVKESSIRRILIQAIVDFRQQMESKKGRLIVPARNKEWKEIYNLSYDIISGMSSSFEDGEILSPGFIVDTWRIWEWLITVSLKVGLGNKLRVIPQAAVTWGQKQTVGKIIRINVYPDVAIYSLSDGIRPLFLVDAKYKLLSEKETIDIERNDLYEAFAFCHASGAKRIFLAYPAPLEPETESGSVRQICNYVIDDVTISVVKIAFGSIAKQGNITAFCRKMSDQIISRLPNAPVEYTQLPVNSEFEDKYAMNNNVYLQIAEPHIPFKQEKRKDK